MNAADVSRSATSDPTDKSRYRVWIRERIRYSDTDMQGHVNNSVISTFFEAGRIALFALPDGGRRDAGLHFAVVNLNMNFRRELYYPGEVEIGTGLLRIGRTSFTVAQAIFSPDSCIATAEATTVLLDHASRRPMPLSDQLREHLERCRVENPV
jgi:acyl-CoA thioester hydrolase